jgi:hypothetical protein
LPTFQFVVQYHALGQTLTGTTYETAPTLGEARSQLQAFLDLVPERRATILDPPAGEGPVNDYEART